MQKKIRPILFVLLTICFSGIKAQSDPNTAEALFIYNFLSHVMWPEGSISDTYIIGVVGTTKTFSELQKITAQRTVGNKKIEVVQYRSVDEITNCHVLLVADGYSSKVPMISKKLEGKNCLIVGETAGTTNYGAVIDFDIVAGKLRYKVNKETAKNKNLYLSAALIQMSL
jgi:hypothetical protein